MLLSSQKIPHAWNHPRFKNTVWELFVEVLCWIPRHETRKMMLEIFVACSQFWIPHFCSSTAGFEKDALGWMFSWWLSVTGSINLVSQNPFVLAGVSQTFPLSFFVSWSRLLAEQPARQRSAGAQSEQAVELWMEHINSMHTANQVGWAKGEDQGRCVWMGGF